MTARDRDAWATIRGFVFQVDTTILRWLDLKESQLLELERGEDIDLIFRAFSASGEDCDRFLEQLKRRDANITLRDTEVVEALASFYEHKTTNPSANLRFRFLTTAGIGLERDRPFGVDPFVKTRFLRI